MTVYQRTADGHWAAYSAESPLPRKLKLLLKAVNGTVDEDVYARNLTAFGDVAELLRSLEQAGLIADADAKSTAKRRKSNAAPDTAAILHRLEDLGQPPDETAWDRTVVLRGPVPTREDVARLATPPAAPPAAPPVAATALPPAAPLSAAVEVALVSNPALQQAIQAMGDFVLTHLPGSAIQVLSEIEAVKTVDDLTELMGGYAQFAAAAGAPGQAHLAQIEQWLASAPGAAFAEPTRPHV